MLNGKSGCWNRCCLWPPLARQKIFCKKPRTLLSSPYLHLTQCAKLLSTHLEANFKNLFVMELATNVVFLLLSSLNKDLCIWYRCELWNHIRSYKWIVEYKLVLVLPVQSTSVSKKPRCSDYRSAVFHKIFERTLVFVQNSEMRERSYFYLSEVFC